MVNLFVPNLKLNDWFKFSDDNFVICFASYGQFICPEVERLVQFQ